MDHEVDPSVQEVDDCVSTGAIRNWCDVNFGYSFEKFYR